MRFISIIVVFSFLTIGCVSNDKKESKSDIAMRQINQQAILPILKKKGLEEYVGLYGLSSCMKLLEAATAMGISPKSIGKRKVVIVAHTGEELSFKYPDNCPEEKRT